MADRTVKIGGQSYPARGRFKARKKSLRRARRVEAAQGKKGPGLLKRAPKSKGLSPQAQAAIAARRVEEARAAAARIREMGGVANVTSVQKSEAQGNPWASKFTTDAQGRPRLDPNAKVAPPKRKHTRTPTMEVSNLPDVEVGRGPNRTKAMYLESPYVKPDRDFKPGKKAEKKAEKKVSASERTRRSWVSRKKRKGQMGKASGPASHAKAGTSTGSIIEKAKLYRGR